MAIVEAANVTGLKVLGGVVNNPWRADSFGLGEMIKDLLNAGHRRFFLGLGGSAVIDAGAGFLTALGVKSYDANGRLLSPNVENFLRLNEVDISGLDSRLATCEIVLGCDT